MRTGGSTSRHRRGIAVHCRPLANNTGQSPAGEMDAIGAAAPRDPQGFVHEQLRAAAPADLGGPAAELDKSRLVK